jgi:hypothetical protein
MIHLTGIPTTQMQNGMRGYEAEGLYADPIHKFTSFDEDEIEMKVEPVKLDFD